MGSILDKSSHRAAPPVSGSRSDPATLRLGTAGAPQAAALLACLALITVLPGVALADEAAGLEFFESRVRPVLVTLLRLPLIESGTEEGVRIDSREAIGKGGRGPAVVPNDAEASQADGGDARRSDVQMPPSREAPRRDRRPAKVDRDGRDRATMLGRADRRLV